MLIVFCAPLGCNELIMCTYVTNLIYNTFQTYDSEAFMDLSHNYNVMSFGHLPIQFIKALAGSDQ